MKIALIRSAIHRTGGVERYVWLLSRELARRGHEVHLIARRCPGLPSPEVHFREVRSWGPLSFLKVLSFASAVRRLLARESFDVVHSCDRVYGCDIYRAGEGLHREWMDVADRYLPIFKRLIRRMDPLHQVLLRIEEKLIAGGGARRVVAISRRSAGEIERHFGMAGVPVIYNGVDPEEFRPPGQGEAEEIRRGLDVERDAFIVLYVGSGFFRKGLRYLIQGFAAACRENGENSVLLVSGKGSIGSHLRLARSLGVEDQVRFLGTQHPAALLYRAANVFVFPTLYEPFGNVCLEALASGLPCIFSLRCGGAEIAEDGKEALVLDDPTDTEEIARLIRACMDDERAGSLGRAARALSLRFSVEANADQTERLYREIVDERDGIN